MVWQWIWNLFTSIEWGRIFFYIIIKFHDQCQKHRIFCLLHFLWFLKMFLSNLSTCMQYTTWRHNYSLFLHCKFWYFHDVKITAWRYHFYSMDKTQSVFRGWKCNKYENKHFKKEDEISCVYLQSLQWGRKGTRDPPRSGYWSQRRTAHWPEIKKFHTKSKNTILHDKDKTSIPVLKILFFFWKKYEICWI